MEIAEVFVADGVCDLIHMLVRIAQQPRRLAQALLLQQLRVILAGLLPDQTREGRQLVMEPSGNLRETPVSIILFQIAKNGNDRVLLLGLKLQRLGVVHQLGKEKAHGHLEDAALVGHVFQKRKEQVFDQILYRKELRHAEQEIARLILPGQATDHKAAQRCLLFSEEGVPEKKADRTMKFTAISFSPAASMDWCAFCPSIKSSP